MDNICSFCIDIILRPCSRAPSEYHSIFWILRARCREHSRYEAFILNDALLFFFFLPFIFHFVLFLFVLCFTLALAVSSSALNGFFVLLCIWLLGGSVCYYVFFILPFFIFPYFFDKNSAICSTVSLSSLCLCDSGSVVLWFCG